MKNQKGITLVALVVTIIVLLILAGISLSLISGSDGILNQATTAADKNADRSAQEQVELLLAEAKNAYYKAKYIDRDATLIGASSSSAETTFIATYANNNYAKVVSNASSFSMDTKTGEISLTVAQTNNSFTVTYSDGALYVSTAAEQKDWPGTLVAGSTPSGC